MSFDRLADWGWFVVRAAHRAWGLPWVQPLIYGDGNYLRPLSRFSEASVWKGS